MNRIPSWGWSLLTIALILTGLLIGGRGPEGRAVSRAVFPYFGALVMIATILSYRRERKSPTGRLWLINLATVAALAYLTVPIWHFGVVLPQTPGDPVVVRWWVNAVVLALGILGYLVLTRLTRTGRSADR